jgi:hypothetical protein
LRKPASCQVAGFRANSIFFNFFPRKRIPIALQRNDFSFVIVRNNIYLAFPFSGLYLSRNNGVDWLPINIGLLESSLGGLEISGLKLFAATATGKLFVRSAI